MKTYLIFFLVSIIQLTGCVSVGIVPLRSNYTRSGEDCKLQLYWSKADIKHKIRKNCLLTSVVPRYPWNDHVLDSAFDYAYPLACKCGADGVYIRQLDNKTLRLVAFSFKSKPQKDPSMSTKEFKERLVCYEQKGTWKESKCENEESANPSENPRKRL